MRLATLSVFAAVGASLAFWLLHWPSEHPAGKTVLAGSGLATGGSDGGQSQNVAVDPAELEHLLAGQGAAAAKSAGTASAPADGNMRLVGVVTHGHEGAALIAIAGQPAKSFAVGRQVRDGLLLQSVGRRQAFLAGSMQGPVSMTLDLPTVPEK